MNATSLALSNICKILNLDFIELWYEVNGSYCCLVHTDSDGMMMGKDEEFLNVNRNVGAGLDKEFSIMVRYFSFFIIL